MEYGNVVIMGARATQLSRLDAVHNVATSLCQTLFCSSLVSLSCCHSWIAVEVAGLPPL